MLEKHEHRRLATVGVVTVFHQGYHAVDVHGFSSEELKILKPCQYVLHHLVHVVLENIHLVRLSLLQSLNQPVGLRKDL